MSLFEEDPDDLYDDAETVKPQATSAHSLLPPRQMAACLGHDSIQSDLLTLAQSGRMPHAFIFAGPSGIGKSTMAFRFIRTLLGSLNDQDKTSHMIAAGGHPDLLTIEREYDEKKGRFKESVSIDSVRGINPFMRLTASMGERRIAVVDDADSMTTEAQNAILKILEEPPAHAVLFLIAHRPGMLVPTIRSRCRVVNFESLQIDVFSMLMKRHDPGMSEADINALFAITSGSIGEAMRLADEGGPEAIAKVAGLLHQWPDWDWPQIHTVAEAISRPGQENSYKAMRNVIVWAVDEISRTMARGTKLPAILDNEGILRLKQANGPESILDMSEAVKKHFATADFANLDKRTALIGAFTLLEQKRAA